MPNVRGGENMRVLSTSDGGPASYYRVAQMSYDSMADLRAGIASDDGRSTIADIANFATGGATLGSPSTEGYPIGGPDWRQGRAVRMPGSGATRPAPDGSPRRARLRRQAAPRDQAGITAGVQVCLASRVMTESYRVSHAI